MFTTRLRHIVRGNIHGARTEKALVEKITTDAQRAEVAAYVEQATRRSERDRMTDTKSKTGVFTGAYAVNPVNGAKIPVWIGDYVLSTYGTGAIMSVPAHDQRDWEFAKAYDLLITAVISGGSIEEAAHTGDGTLINSDELNGLSVKDAKKRIIEQLEKSGAGKGTVNFKLRDWLFSRQRYWGEPFQFSTQKMGKSFLSMKRTFLFVFHRSRATSLRVRAKVHCQRSKTGVRSRCPTERPLDGKQTQCHSGRVLAGITCDIWTPTTPKLLGQRKKKILMPVDLYIGGAEHAVLHLLYARFWHKVLYDLGHVSTPEPFKKLIHQGMILGEDGQKMSKSRGNVVNPDDVIDEYGADAMRLFEMFIGPLEAVTQTLVDQRCRGRETVP